MIGYVGKETAKVTILTRLKYAQDWLRAGVKDEPATNELRIAIVCLLAQSPRTYDLARLKARSLSQLVELAISDVDCAPFDYQCPWQLEQFTGGEKISTARKKGQHKCAECGKRFRASRKRTYCTPACRSRHNNRKRRMMSLGISDVSEAA